MARLLRMIGFGLLPLLAVQAVAHDDKGRFALKGAGMTPCKHYVAQVKDKTREVYAYAGWIEGYLTAVNAYEKTTYDIAPWQNTRLLALMVARYCQGHPDEAFGLAVRKLVRALHPQRMQQHSPLVVARNGDQAIRLYRGIVQEVQRRLAEAGLYEGARDGAYGPATRKAVQAFQKREGLQPSGLPDMATLARLFESSFKKSQSGK